LLEQTWGAGAVVEKDDDAEVEEAEWD